MTEYHHHDQHHPELSKAEVRVYVLGNILAEPV